MNVFIIDDERLALKSLATIVEKLLPEAKLYTFSRAAELLETLEEVHCDIAFLDIKMPGITGVQLARKMKEKHAETNFIFTTGYSDYAVDAMELHASGYVMKPVREERIQEELQHLRYPVAAETRKGLYIQCFGNFEIFYDGKPVVFKHKKTKELAAYLIDRHGAGCTMGELLAVLWEDKPVNMSQKSQLRNLISDLRGTFKVYQLDGIIFKGHNVISMDTAQLQCDYFDFLAGKPQGLNQYHGEYMRQYSWAEVTTAALFHK